MVVSERPRSEPFSCETYQTEGNKGNKELREWVTPNRLCCYLLFDSRVRRSIASIRALREIRGTFFESWLRLGWVSSVATAMSAQSS